MQIIEEPTNLCIVLVSNQMRSRINEFLKKRLYVDQDISNVLKGLIQELAKNNEETWTRYIELHGTQNVVPLDKWNLSSCIQFWPIGCRGTHESFVAGERIVTPIPSQNKLLLVFLEGPREFEADDLSHMTELMQFFERKKGKSIVYLSTDKDVNEFCL
jgi:hypothetical protein